MRGTLRLLRAWQGRGELKEDHGVHEREAKQPENEAMADNGADQNLARRTEPVLICTILTCNLIKICHVLMQKIK